MKQLFSTICLVVATLFVATSCLKDDNSNVESPQCAITSFKVGDIKSKMTIQKEDGTDSTFTVSFSGSTIYFNIDQINNRIETVDSLPNWLNISAVVPTITSNGYVYVRQQSKGDDFTSFSSGKDSIDFTKDVRFMVVSYDQTSIKTYQAFIHKATTDRDSLYWTTPTEAHPVNGLHHSVVLGERVLVFSENGGSPTVTTTSADGTEGWTTPTALTGATGVIDYASVIVFGKALYALDADGHLCRSTAEQAGAVWEIVGSRTFIRMLAADAIYLYAADDSGILCSHDLENWKGCGSTDLEMLPKNPVSSVYYDTKTNTSLQNVVMLGLSDQNTTNTAVWYKISSADEKYNQAWDYIRITNDNPYGLPYMKDVHMIRYNNMLMAFGEPFDALYRSYDNGITWHAVTSLLALPADLQNTTSICTSAFVAGGKIWILQSGGKWWKGTIGRVATNN